MKTTRALCTAALTLTTLAASAGFAQAGTGGLGDGNGDGVADVWATQAIGRYSTSPYNGQTFFSTGIHSKWNVLGLNDGVPSPDGLAAASQVVAMPDMTGDHKADVLGHIGTQLFLFKNDGTGKLSQSTEIGHGWGSYDNIIYAGHLNGGTDNYLLARKTTDHNLYAYKFTASGALTDMGQAGQNWGNVRFMLAPGQITGDAKDDLMAIDTKGDMNCYRSAGLGKLSNAGVCGHGWGGFRYAFIAGDIDNDGKWDLVGVRDVVHKGTSCSKVTGACDHAEPPCANAPLAAYPGEYETVAAAKVRTSRTDQCEKLGYTYRLKDFYRAPMYVYRNKGNAQWGSAEQIGYDEYQYDTFA